MADTYQRRCVHGTRRRICAAALAVGALVASAGCSATDTVEAAPEAATSGYGSGSASASGSSSGSAVQLTPAVAAQLDTAINRVLKQANVPGVIVGLSIPGNGTYTRAFGVADRTAGTAMSTGLNMRIGSETKTFTVTALLRLVDAGKVALDDPVGKYVSNVPNGDRITLRQLAEMRSGLYSYSNDPDFAQALISDPKRSFTPQELLAYAFKHPVVFDPGAQFQYSNTNAVLLGLVVEKASGQALQDYLQQQVFAPAGLRHTVLPTDATFPDPHARGYTNQTSNGAIVDATDWNPSWGWAAGAMISNLADLQNWAGVLATGALLSPATQAQRLNALPTGYPDTGYGLGLFIDHGWIGHNGSLPGYQSLVLYLPSVKASLVVLTNTDVGYQGSENSTLFGQAITGIVTPGNVFSLPAMPSSSASGAPSSSSPSPSPSSPSPSPSASASSSASPSASASASTSVSASTSAETSASASAGVIGAAFGDRLAVVRR